MSMKTDFEEKVLKDISYELPAPGERRICRNAQAFVSWCDNLVRDVQRNPTDKSIGVALQSLQHRLRRVCEDAPDECNSHFSPDSEYYCLLACWKDTYDLLAEQGMTALAHQMIKPNRHTIAAIPAGEIEGILA